MTFSNLLIKWYLQNRRELPWRNTRDPYLIWLSEIILQQTRVAQGMSYYFAFADAFPTIKHLAEASEEQVLRLWQGLGYYSRARNLHATARQVVADCHGIFPQTYKDLLELKGVGEYTAGAIASFAYNEAVPVVDGNVYRVLSRYFEIRTDISTGQAKREFRALAAELLPHDRPADFNQAIMELGALQCVPKNPDCGQCPLNGGCLALKNGSVHELPVKARKARPKQRFFNYLVITNDEDHAVIQKRTTKDIWFNLYEFPLIETLSEEEITGEMATPFIGSAEITRMSGYGFTQVSHKLTHQHLHIRFWRIDIKGHVENSIGIGDLKAFPFPIVIYNYIESEFL